MSETDSWLMRRLESDFEQARAEIINLRTKIDARDVLIRELERKVTWYEIREEVLQQAAPNQSLADFFKPDVVGKILESLPPWIALLQGFAGHSAQAGNISSTAPITFDPINTSYGSAPSIDPATSTNSWGNQ